MRGRRQAHNPTLAKILRLTYNRSCSHNRPQTAACNAVYSISRRALLITRLGEQLPRPRQVSMIQNSVPTYTCHTTSTCSSYGIASSTRKLKIFSARKFTKKKNTQLQTAQCSERAFRSTISSLCKAGRFWLLGFPPGPFLAALTPSTPLPTQKFRW